MDTRVRSPLRTAVIVLGSVEALALLLFDILMLQGTDPIGKSIGQGMVMLSSIPLLLGVLPGLALGLANRWLPAALLLLVLAGPLAFLLWSSA